LEAAGAGSNASEEFVELAGQILHDQELSGPTSAARMGLHEYDGKLDDLSAEALSKKKWRLSQFQQRLQELPPAVSAEEEVERQTLALVISLELYQIETPFFYRKNPTSYLWVFDVNDYLVRDFAPLSKRLRSIISLERQLPNLLAAARANLVAPLPRPFIDTAILQAKGQVTFLAHDWWTL
jgi:Bacterial protein of unknown function (DUF885)